MAGIAGSHSNSLAPMVPGTQEAQAGMQAQADAKPIPMQAPEQQAPDQSAPTPEPTPAPAIPAQKPSLDDLMAQAQQSAPAEKPSLDDLMKQAKETEPKHWYDTSLKDVGNFALEHLPEAGMIGGGIAGGVLGTPTGPAAVAGSIAGAAMGKQTGEALKIGIKHALGDTEGVPATPEAYLSKLNDALKSGAVEQSLGEGAGAAIAKTIPLLTSAASKVTGVSKWGIKTYAKAADQVDKILDTYGKDLVGASDAIKEGWQDAINGTIKTYSDQITNTLKGNKSKVSIEPVVNELKSVLNNISGVQKQMNPEEIGELNSLLVRLAPKEAPTKEVASTLLDEWGKPVINTIAGAPKSAMLDAEGKMSIAAMNELKTDFQNQAKAVYTNTRTGAGAVNRSDLYAKVAANLASKARAIVDSAAPEVAEANAGIQEFYKLDNKLATTLLNPKTGEAAIMAAGRGANPKFASDLTQLGNLTGKDFLHEAKIYSAAKELGSSSASWTAGALKTAISAGRVPAEIAKKISSSAPVESLTSALTPYEKVFMGQLFEKLNAGENVDKFVKQFKKPIPVDNAPAK